MPTYDYKCLSCGHKFSVFIPVKEKDNVRCPVCGEAKVSQVFSGAGIAVKSNGQGGSGCGSSRWGFG